MTSMPSVKRIFASQIGNLEGGDDSRRAWPRPPGRVRERGDGFAPRSDRRPCPPAARFSSRLSGSRRDRGLACTHSSVRSSSVDRSRRAARRPPWPHRRRHGHGSTTGRVSSPPARILTGNSRPRVTPCGEQHLGRDRTFDLERFQPAEIDDFPRRLVDVGEAALVRHAAAGSAVAHPRIHAALPDRCATSGPSCRGRRSCLCRSRDRGQLACVLGVRPRRRADRPVSEASSSSPSTRSALCADVAPSRRLSVALPLPRRRRHLFDLDQMANLGHHPADRRVVRALDRRVQLAQPERRDRPPLIRGTADRAPHQRDAQDARVPLSLTIRSLPSRRAADRAPALPRHAPLPIGGGDRRPLRSRPRSRRTHRRPTTPPRDVVRRFQLLRAP